MRIQSLERTIKILHDEAKRLQVLFLMNHIQQRSIILINNNNSLLASLLMSTFHQPHQTLVGCIFIIFFAINLFIRAEYEIKITRQSIGIHVYSSTHIKKKDWVFFPIPFIICNGKSFKKFFSAIEICLKCRGKK